MRAAPGRTRPACRGRGFFIFRQASRLVAERNRRISSAITYKYRSERDRKRLGSLRWRWASSFAKKKGWKREWVVDEDVEDSSCGGREWVWWEHEGDCGGVVLGEVLEVGWFWARETVLLLFTRNESLSTVTGVHVPGDVCVCVSWSVLEEGGRDVTFLVRRNLDGGVGGISCRQSRQAAASKQDHNGDNALTIGAKVNLDP